MTSPAPTPPLDAATLRGLLPHQGTMCLIDRVDALDATRVRARSGGHRDPAHPLRLDGALPAVCAVEIAAQAMALHARLSAPADAPPRAGYIAALRAVTLAVARLDDIPGDLIAECELHSGDARQAAYRFTVSDEAGRALAEGRLTVVVEPPAPAPGPGMPTA